MGRLKKPKLFGYIGRRGYSLLFFAILYLILGQSYLTTPPSPAGREALWSHLQLMPLKAWAVLWMISGSCSLVGVFWKKFEGLAFALASGVVATWACGFAFSTIFGHGYRSYVSFMIWASFSAFILLISGWPEERDYGE